jgi:hypothetical protein
VPLRHSQTNGVGKTLAKRAGSDLNSGSGTRLGMAWRDTVDFLGTSQKL